MIRVSQADLAALDAARGNVSRSAYIRSLLHPKPLSLDKPVHDYQPPEKPVRDKCPHRWNSICDDCAKEKK